jgi:hypothetical protein
MDKKQHRAEMLQSENMVEKHKRAVKRAGRLYRQLSAELTAKQLRQLNILMNCWNVSIEVARRKDELQQPMRIYERLQLLLGREIQADELAGLAKQFKIPVGHFYSLEANILNHQAQQPAISYAVIVTRDGDGQIGAYCTNSLALKMSELREAMSACRMITSDKFRLAVNQLPFAAGRVLGENNTRPGFIKDCERC